MNQSFKKIKIKKIKIANAAEKLPKKEKKIEVPKSEHVHKSPGPLSGPSLLLFLALKEFVQTAGLHFAQPDHKLGQ